MELVDDKGWIEITMNSYAEDAVCYSSTLQDIHNAVDVSLNYSCKEIGWGVVGDYYFNTHDIAFVAKGLTELLEGKQEYFEYLAPYIWNKELEGYTLVASKVKEGYKVSLRIYDDLDDYPTVVEIMNKSEFEKIVKEFQDAAIKFPVR